MDDKFKSASLAMAETHAEIFHRQTFGPGKIDEVECNEISLTDEPAPKPKYQMGANMKRHNSDKSVVVTERPEDGVISFTNQSGELLRFEKDGSVFVKGEKAGSSEEVYDQVVAFFKTHDYRPGLPMHGVFHDGDEAVLISSDGANMGKAMYCQDGQFTVLDNAMDIKVGKEFWFMAGVTNGDPTVAYGKVTKFQITRDEGESWTYCWMKLPNGHVEKCNAHDLFESKEEAEKKRRRWLEIKEQG